MAVISENKEENVLIQEREQKKRKQKIIFVFLVLGIFLLLVVIIGIVVGILQKVQQVNEIITPIQTPQIVPQPENKTECQDNWLKIKDSCFKFLPGSCPAGCPWSAARQMCRRENGILAEPKKPEVLEDLIEFARNEFNESDFWIGLKYDSHGISQTYVWDSDEEPVDKKIDERFWYNNKKPLFDGINVYMKKDGNLLADDQKDIIPFKPICQKHQTDQNSTLNITIEEAECPSPFKYHSGKCFKFMKESCPYGCSWEDAKRVCSRKRMILAEPEFYIKKGKNSTKEMTELTDYEFLKNLADQTHPISNWWIGITDVDTEGTFKKESSKKVSRNIANSFDHKISSSDKKDCLYLKKDKNIKHSHCKKSVEKEKKDFNPQPLCMI